jgi:hypothetical protein
MSLMRLLQMNRSVGGAADGGRYKLQKNFLPKFSPVGRPVSLAPAKNQSQKVTMETPSLFDQSKASGAAEASAESSVPHVLSVGVFPKPEVAETEAEVEFVRKEGWFARLKNLFRRKAPKTTVRPVQTEWMLDKVKVIRNDLADCDLDVVVADVGGEAPRVKGKSLVGRAWKRVEVPVEKLQPAETVK